MEPTIRSHEARVLAELLRTLREDAELSQAELARELAEPQQFVSSVERGERRLDVIEARIYAAALGLSLPRLVELFESAISRSREGG